MPDKAPDFQIVIGTHELTIAERRCVSHLELQESLEETAQLEFHITESETAQFDPAIFKLGTPIRLSLGYVNELSELFDGDIVRVSPDFPQKMESAKLIITCQDRSYRMKRAGGPMEFAPPKYPTLFSIVKFIVDKYGLKLVLNPEDVLKQAVQKDDQHVLQENETDWLLIYDYVNPRDYRFFVRSNTVYIVKNDWLKRQQTKRLNLIYQPEADQLRNGALPLLSFHPEVGSDGQRSRIEVLSWHVKRDTPDKYSKALLNQMQTEPDADTYTEIQFRAEIIETFKIFNRAVRDEAEARKLAEAELQRRADNFVRGYDAVIAGNPHIRLGQEHDLQLNALRKHGQQFSGPYWITAVRHELTLDEGYLTYFDCTRSGLSKI